MFGLWSDMRKRELVTSFQNSLIGFFIFLQFQIMGWASNVEWKNGHVTFSK